VEIRTVLFEEGGKHNTTPTLEIARDRALALGIEQVVVASSHGYTAREAHRILSPEGIGVVAVQIAYSWHAEGWTMSPQERADLEALGVVVHAGIHALGGGVGMAFSSKHAGWTAAGVVRDTLYLFSQGMKVAVECLLMAADAGLLKMDREVIAIGGSSAGADTAIVCKPAYPRTFHELEIREILAKPRIP
jgi:hypothetical protein